MNFEIEIIKGQVVADIINAKLTTCVDVVRRAYLAHGARDSVNPPSYFLNFPKKTNARIIALPAYLGGGFDVSGLKWIASYPDNVKKGFPRASAVLILNDCETGYPFAILEASIISAARTAASAVLAAEWLNKGSRKAKCLGLVGNGLISRYLYNFFINSGWQFDEVRLFDLNPAESARFAATVCSPTRHQKILVSKSAAELFAASDVVGLATIAATAHLEDPQLLAHRPLVLHLSLRDLSPELILNSNNVVDDVEHVMKASTSVHLAEQKVGHRRFVNGTLSELMEGKCTLDPSRATVFSPFGLGVLDLAVGKWVYDEARAAGKGLRLGDFFYELSR